jgi:hypothetical protein
MYHVKLCVLPTVHVCVPCDFDITDYLLYPQRAITDGFRSGDGVCTLRVTKWIFYVTEIKVGIFGLSWLRRLVAGLSPWRPGFVSKSVHVRFVADKVAVGQVYLLVFLYFLVSNIPPMLHTLLFLHVALTRRTNARNLGTFWKAVLFRESGSNG